MGCCGERACLKKSWAIPQKQNNCATFVASKLAAGNVLTPNTVNSFQLGRATRLHSAALWREWSITLTRWVFCFPFISNIRGYGVVFINIWSMTTFHWFALWQQKAAYRRQPAVYSFFTHSLQRGVQRATYCTINLEFPVHYVHWSNKYCQMMHSE